MDNKISSPRLQGWRGNLKQFIKILNFNVYPGALPLIWRKSFGNFFNLSKHVTP